ncbi:MAG: twin-arginine translocase TatA/TatE family subunit [bacterium]|jgi:sec-independent protein translocase protein TatA|nr:twin-arginine translocase TatA/TatE family subunit [bacterium]MDE0353636.1 twin-arginine translocase TatA/TatE family subunit [bacterium]
MIPKIQGGEIIIILVVILLLFGARKLPELARSLGSSAREFRKGVEEGRTEEQDEAAPTTMISDSNTTTSGTET